MRGNTRWTSDEKLATSKLDDDVKNQHGVARGTDQTPRQLADEPTLNSPRATTTSCEQSSRAYLNTNKNWTAHDFRNDTKESDPMEVGLHEQRQRQRQEQRQRQRQRQRQKQGQGQRQRQRQRHSSKKQGQEQRQKDEA